jgi:hypothetical protein
MASNTACLSLRAFDLGEDSVGVFRPRERDRAVRAGVRADGCSECLTEVKESQRAVWRVMQEKKHFRAVQPGAAGWPDVQGDWAHCSAHGCSIPPCRELSLGG